MATAIQRLPVATPAQLEQMVTSYIAQGYLVANRTPESVTMLKKKEFSVLWAVIGFVVCLIPLLIYLIVYATQQDEMVEIRLDPVAALGSNTTGVQLSPDRSWWWDGTGWQDATKSAPPTAQYSGDRSHWWDGHIWRPVAIEISTLDSAPAPCPPPNQQDAVTPISEPWGVSDDSSEDSQRSASG